MQIFTKYHTKVMRQKDFGFFFVSLITLLSLSEQQAKTDLFPLTIVHINDFHARFEPSDTSGGICGDDEICIGGYARIVYTVKRLLEDDKNTNAVYFNAGDNFHGTLWYIMGRWNITSQFLNLLPPDAMTLGNHEFANGVKGLVPFLTSLNTTVVVANMDSSKEPEISGKYKSSIVIERSNRKIGVIGVIWEKTNSIASTGNLNFRNESETIIEEAKKLKFQGANIIIVISHCGYDIDKFIAEHAGADIDVIVGGHSHSFLYTGNNSEGPDTPRGDYPTQVIHTSGNRVLIVQAGSYAKYVGNLTVYFDSDGNAVNFEGAPIYMDSRVPQDSRVLAALQPWRKEIHARGKVIVGDISVDLIKSTCGYEECNLGNFFRDAMVQAYLDVMPCKKNFWAHIPIGLVNAGALKTALYRGRLTYSKIVALSPFENNLTAFDLPGERLLEALEYGASKIYYSRGINRSHILLQVSGLKITYDFKKPVYERVVDLKVGFSNCSHSRYTHFNKTSIYRVVSTSYLQNGGSGYYMFHDYSSSNLRPLINEVDALVKYAMKITPINIATDGRITVL